MDLNRTEKRIKSIKVINRHTLIDSEEGWCDIICPVTGETSHYVIECPGTQYMVCKGCGLII